jgi:hypothetical protein
MIISDCSRIDLKRGAAISDLKINSPCTELIFPFAAQTQRAKNAADELERGSKSSSTLST